MLIYCHLDPNEQISERLEKMRFNFWSVNVGYFVQAWLY